MYVEEFKSQKMSFLQPQGPRIHDLSELQPSKMQKFMKEQFSEPPNVLKWQFLNPSNT